MVDGLSRTQAFLRITFPLLAPGLVASGVYAFLQAWNEFTVALVVMTEDQIEDAAAVAARIRAGLRDPRDRLGPGHGRLHAGRRAGDHLLHDRAGPDDLGPGRRGGEGLMNRSIPATGSAADALSSSVSVSARNVRRRASRPRRRHPDARLRRHDDACLDRVRAW